MMRLTIYFVIAALLITSGAMVKGAYTGEADAQALFEQKCSICHSTDRPKSKKKTASEWAATVERMRKNGCPLTDEEAKVIVDHLAKNYGK